MSEHCEYPKPDEVNIHVPLTCVLHGEKLQQLINDMRQVRVAVCGDRDYGIPGLVKDVEELKNWRKRLDLRVAAIAGVVSGMLSAAKWLLQK